MKVLFLTNVPSPYRVDFFNILGKLCNLTVLFETKSAKSRDSAWVPDKIENFRAIYLHGIRIGEAEAFSLEVFRYLSLKKYDIIVVGMYSSPTGMLAIEYMRVKKIPFIISSDGGIKRDSFYIKYWMKKHFIHSAFAWLSTGVTTTEYLTYYGADTKRIYRYPFTSVKRSEILGKPLSNVEKGFFRKKLGIEESRVFLSVGQFIYRKGYDVLLKAWSQIDKSVGIYLVGGKPTKEYLELQELLGLFNVHFVEFMPKQILADYYRAADVFILPTREDIWGLVVNEAMAYGLPVITTEKCVAGIEMIRNGQNGYIVPVENVEKLVDAIKHADLLDPYMSIKTAQMYCIEEMAEKHLEYFEQIRNEIEKR